MKHRKLLMIIIVLICSFMISAKAQSPYYDAIKLSKLDYDNENDKIEFLSGGEDSLFIILEKYCIDCDYEKLYNELITNPFINIPENANKSVEGLSPESGVLSSIAGLNVTTFADGLAKFLVKRTKEELNVAFFGRMK